MADDIILTFRKNVAFFLEHLGIKRTDLVKSSKISFATLKVEEADYNITLSTVQAVADAFGISWRLLLLDQDSLEFKQLCEFMDVRLAIRKKLLIDPEFYGIIDYCVLPVNKIMECRRLEKRYFKSISTISRIRGTGAGRKPKQLTSDDVKDADEENCAEFDESEERDDELEMQENSALEIDTQEKNDEKRESSDESATFPENAHESSK